MLHLLQPLSLSNLEGHMVFIEGGTFEMGYESYLDNANPIHKVQLDDFYLCRYPVSQQLWYEVMGENPEELMFENPHRPVERVSWEDIEERFLPVLREKTGIRDYGLPTEAQWEYAARGGKYRQTHVGLPASEKVDYPYSGSDHLKEVAWYDDNSYQETLPVSLKRPNQLGLYDMSGNVFEWCQDWYDWDYYQTLKDQYGNRPAPNPTGPETGSSRVVRGGSWDINTYNSRVSYRNSTHPYLRYSLIGFRLCRYTAR